MADLVNGGCVTRRVHGVGSDPGFRGRFMAWVRGEAFTMLD